MSKEEKKDALTKYYSSIGQHEIKVGKYVFEVNNHPPQIAGAGRLAIGFSLDECFHFDKKKHSCCREPSVELDIYVSEASGYFHEFSLPAVDIDLYIAAFQAAKKELKLNKKIKFAKTGHKDYIMTI